MLNSFHDHEVLAVAYDPAQETLCLRIRSPSGDIVELKLQGCSQFRVNDFIRQNVISRLTLRTGPDLEQASLRRSLSWVTSLTDSQSFLTVVAEQRIAQELFQQKLILLECIPSYGAEIVALCRSFELVRTKAQT